MYTSICPAIVAGLQRVSDEGSVSEISAIPALNVFTAANGSFSIFYLLLLQLVLCRVSPYYIFLLVL